VKLSGHSLTIRKTCCPAHVLPPNHERDTDNQTTLALLTAQTTNNNLINNNNEQWFRRTTISYTSRPSRTCGRPQNYSNRMPKRPSWTTTENRSMLICQRTGGMRSPNKMLMIKDVLPRLRTWQIYHTSMRLVYPEPNTTKLTFVSRTGCDPIQPQVTPHRPKTLHPHRRHCHRNQSLSVAR
jgi:hypothetical protein